MLIINYKKKLLRKIFLIWEMDGWNSGTENVT